MERAGPSDDQAVILYSDESYQIIGEAMRVWNALGFGMREFIYENSMLVALKKNGFDIEQQRCFQVYFDGELVGEQKVDMIVDGIILLELKTVEKICREHVFQVMNYLKITRLRLGLLINFGPKGVETRRVVL